MHLIRAKIEPPQPVPHVVRGRLVASLQASVRSASATAIVGRAGTGKTVTVGDLAARIPRRVAWLNVDAPDTDFGRFLEYLAATLSFARLDTEDPNAAADRLLVDLFEIVDEPLLLIVEDLHLVYDADWFSPFFSRFLALLPPAVHVLVTCRSLPPSPLWRMRSKQALVIYDEEILAFTELEAVTLFDTYGLSPDVAREATRQCRGRAMTLDMTAQSLAARLAERPKLLLRRTG